jgi:nucleoid-associated protein YgaU
MSKQVYDQDAGSLESAPTALPEPEGPSAPNVGREIKIGVTVIVVLLIVFGAVLYRRLAATTARPTADQRRSEKHEERQASSLPPLGSAFDGGSSQPPVVTATAGSSHSSRRISVAEMAETPWPRGGDSVPADRSEPPSQPKPSFMPPLPPADVSGGSPWVKHKHQGEMSKASFASANESDSGLPPPPPPKRSDAGQNPFSQVPPLPPATFVSSGKTSPVQPLDRTPAGSGDAANPLRDPAAGDTVPPPPPSAASYGVPSSGSYAGSSLPAATAQPGSISGDNGGPGARSTDASALPPAYGASSSPAYGAGAPPAYGAGSPPAYGSASAAPADGMTAGALSSPYSGSGAPHLYTVQPNDNYWKISEKVYGTGAYFQALAEHNRKKIPDENRLRPGDTVSIPPVGDLEKKYADLCPKPSHRDTTRRQLATASTISPASQQLGGGRVYVVQEGDNLYDIARWELGKVTRWPEIYDLNREALGSDPDHLTPGMRLVLPGDRPGAVNKVTERPEDTIYRR